MQPIRRIILQSILDKIGENKVIVITGARRVGKTVLLDEISSRLSINCLRLNGDDADSAALLEYPGISNYRRLTEGYTLLMIDEAQQIPEIGKKVKLMIDGISDLTIILTGSSALDLHQHTGEPLTGRQYIYHLFPIAQMELSANENRLQTKQNLEDRLIYGSYPELLSKTNEWRKTYLKEILASYLLRDLLAYEGIRNAGRLMDLLRLLAFQTGSEVSYSELAGSLGISRNTVENYLDLLSKVFVIFKLGAYSGNLRKEVRKSAKWYFHDNGIRNALISNFSPLSLRQDQGQLWENYLVSERIKKTGYEQTLSERYFWRTYDQQEIDWIEYLDGNLSAWEFKWKHGTGKAPAAFSKSYPASTFQIVSPENYLDFIT